MNRFDRQLLQIALPSIVSNITVPLLGMIDLAIVGHLGDAAYIGAIAVGGLMFNIMYWLFGFLRMGTGGMTSQAFGSRNLDETKRLLIRSLAIAWSVAACFIAFQIPIRHLAFGLIKPSSDVAALAQIYFQQMTIICDSPTISRPIHPNMTKIKPSILTYHGIQLNLIRSDTPQGHFPFLTGRD